MSEIPNFQPVRRSLQLASASLAEASLHAQLHAGYREGDPLMCEIDGALERVQICLDDLDEK